MFTRILSGGLQSYRGFPVGRGSNRGGRGILHSSTSTDDYSVQGAGQAPQGPPTQPGGLQEPRRATSPPPQAAPPAQQATTREVVVINRVVIRRVGEPFPAWRDHLIAAFRALKPELSGSHTRRYKIGRVARMVMLASNEDSYLVGARYDLNTNPGAQVDSYNRVVEALIRRARFEFAYCPRTHTLLPYSSTMLKADCGIRIVISLRPISQALQL